MISRENIKVLPHFDKLGVSETGVLFHIIEFPKHGELSFGQNNKKRKVFSLAVLNANTIRYIHNGKESVEDSFVFEIEIEGEPGVILPHYLTMRQRELFEIRILPVNDKPRISGTIGETLLLASGSKMQLPPQFLQVSDEDTKLDQIVIFVSYNDTRKGFLSSQQIFFFSIQQLLQSLLQELNFLSNQQNLRLNLMV